MDIISLPIEFDKEKIDSRFRLVIIAVQRATELSKDPKLGQGKYKKITTNAIVDAITGKIDFLTGYDARKNLEKAEKLDYRKWLTEKKRHIGDISELEKELKVYLHEQEDKELKANNFGFSEITLPEQSGTAEEFISDFDNQEIQ
ncbi:MAG: DNA-directed RNA polymerase subunit omega [Thermodesulfovibrionales bacterium]|nr:DNA-directed RNA polymerase subunit omega [Thermodesulfovibrionales bacterium]